MDSAGKGSNSRYDTTSNYLTYRTMSAHQCGVDGRVAVAVPRVDCSRRGDEKLDGLQVPVPTGKVQRRVVVRQKAFVDDGSGVQFESAYGEQRAALALAAAAGAAGGGG